MCIDNGRRRAIELLAAGEQQNHAVCVGAAHIQKLSHLYI